MVDDNELERIAEERLTIMDSGDRSGENGEEYEKLGREYDNEIDRQYSQK
jgi:hypothetical protein